MTPRSLLVGVEADGVFISIDDDVAKLLKLDDPLLRAPVPLLLLGESLHLRRLSLHDHLFPDALFPIEFAQFELAEHRHGEGLVYDGRSLFEGGGGVLEEEVIGCSGCSGGRELLLFFFNHILVDGLGPRNYLQVVREWELGEVVELQLLNGGLADVVHRRGVRYSEHSLASDFGVFSPVEKFDCKRSDVVTIDVEHRFGFKNYHHNQNYIHKERVNKKEKKEFFVRVVDGMNEEQEYVSQVLVRIEVKKVCVGYMQSVLFGEDCLLERFKVDDCRVLEVVRSILVSKLFEAIQSKYALSK